MCTCRVCVCVCERLASFTAQWQELHYHSHPHMFLTIATLILTPYVMLALSLISLPDKWKLHTAVLFLCPLNGTLQNRKMHTMLLSCELPLAWSQKSRRPLNKPHTRLAVVCEFTICCKEIMYHIYTQQFYPHSQEHLQTMREREVWFLQAVFCPKNDVSLQQNCKCNKVFVENIMHCMDYVLMQHLSCFLF